MRLNRGSVGSWQPKPSWFTLGEPSCLPIVVDLAVRNSDRGALATGTTKLRHWSIEPATPLRIAIRWRASSAADRMNPWCAACLTLPPGCPCHGPKSGRCHKCVALSTTTLPAGGDGSLRCSRVARRQGWRGWRGEQGHYGLYRQNAGPQPNVCLFLTNGAMRGKVK